MAQSLNQVVEAFSVSHAQILDGATAFAAATSTVDNDIYGVADASIDAKINEYINEGDDAELSTWHWTSAADVKVQEGFLSFPLIAAITGHTLSTSGSGAGQATSVDLWHEDEANIAAKPIIIVMPARDALGNIKTLKIGLYKVQFSPIQFDGPKYKNGLKVNWSGKAVYSPVDELGATFSDNKKRVGKLLVT